MKTSLLGLVMFVRRAEVYNRQRGENKGLQRYHKNVEDGPWHVQQPDCPERQ